jgi:hypothetical protein
MTDSELIDSLNSSQDALELDLPWRYLKRHGCMFQESLCRFMVGFMVGSQVARAVVDEIAFNEGSRAGRTERGCSMGDAF